METPLIGSGGQEQVDLRVQAIKDLGTSRGYLTYEELNEKLPDEVVSPDKLDSLLMMIDEMGIRLIDESRHRASSPRAETQAAKSPKPPPTKVADRLEEEDGEEIDINLEKPNWPRPAPSGSTTRCGCTSPRWARSPC